ncbi:MAG: hypothetical protein IJ693_00505 [Bacteroidaceae bacterium]|nr:hypothetical protein [Bacteroidaceae bacterium]
MKIINGIIMVAFTTLLFTFLGCSQDDEYYNSDMYTMAEQLETRGGEPGGQGKKRIYINPHCPQDIRPTDIPSPTTPTLYGEYDDTTLSIFINGYSGSAQVSVLSVLGHHLMGYAEEMIESGVQIDFSLTSYTHGRTYQIFITLDNGDAYWGEFNL